MEPDAELLEVLLEKARNTITFLHECLINPKWAQYAYPEMTMRFLEELDGVLPPRDYCIHSKVDPNCESCMQGVRTREILTRLPKRKDE